MNVLDWITEHWDDLAIGAGYLWGLINLIVGLTPSTEDDQWLRKLGERLSALAAANDRRTFKLPGAK